MDEGSWALLRAQEAEAKAKAKAKKKAQKQAAKDKRRQMSRLHAARRKSSSQPDMFEAVSSTR